MTDEHNHLSALAKFNADALISYFGTKPHQVDETNIMRFVYDMTYAEGSTHEDRLTRSRKAVAAAIESIEFSHSVLRVYGEDFMRHEPKFSRSALVYAVLGGQHLEKANEPLEQTFEDIEADVPPKFPGEYLDEAALRDGIIILEEVDSLMAGGWFNPDKNPYAESFLTAHIFAMRSLKEFEENFAAYDHAEVKKFEEDNLKPYLAFAQPHTQLGELLIGYIEIIRERIAEMPPPEPERPRGFRPYLAVDNTAPRP